MPTCPICGYSNSEAPPEVMERLQRYVINGIEPGDFLLVVLENNLVEAFRRADCVNAAAMHAIVAYCYNNLPALCWGNKSRVTAWLQMDEVTRDRILSGL